MTAQPLRSPATSRGLRVISGRRAARPSLAPWLVFTLVAIVAFLGMVLTRTALDRSAIELAAVERAIAEARSTNQILRLEIGRLESPARIAPLAIEMGMVYPTGSEALLVSGVIPDGEVDPRWADLDHLSVGVEETTTVETTRQPAVAALAASGGTGGEESTTP